MALSEEMRRVHVDNLKKRLSEGWSIASRFPFDNPEDASPQGSRRAALHAVIAESDRLKAQHGGLFIRVRDDHNQEWLVLREPDTQVVK